MGWDVKVWCRGARHVYVCLEAGVQEPSLVVHYDKEALFRCT